MSPGCKGQKHTNNQTDPLLLIPGRGCRCSRIIKAPMPQLLRQTTSFRASFLPAAETGLVWRALQGHPSPELEQGLSQCCKGLGPPAPMPGSAQPWHLYRPRRVPQERASLRGGLGTSAATSGIRLGWYCCKNLGLLSPRLAAGDAARGTSPNPDQGHQNKNTFLNFPSDCAPLLTHQLEKHMCPGLSWLPELASPHRASATQSREHLLCYCQRTAKAWLCPSAS